MSGIGQKSGIAFFDFDHLTCLLIAIFKSSHHHRNKEEKRPRNFKSYSENVKFVKIGKLS